MHRSNYTSLTNSVSSSLKYQSCLTSVNCLIRITLFFVGLCCGVMFSVTFYSALRSSKTSLVRSAYYIDLESSGDDGVFNDTHDKEEIAHKGEDLVADTLSDSVRVACLVLTTKTTYEKNVPAIKNTWGSRCNDLLFVSNFEDRELPVVKLQEEKGNVRNWGLVKAGLTHVYEHLLATNDWVLRTDDSTFVIVENLRYLLAGLNATEALYLGCRFKQHVEQGFMSGGAGYVLSKKAVTLAVEEGFSQKICNGKEEGLEDVEMGKCMEKLKVPPIDTRDSLGRGRSFPFSPESHIIPGAIKPDNWYWSHVYYPPHTGFNCCSDTAISFHGIGYKRMHVLNYLIYHLRPFGINPHQHPLPLTFASTHSNSTSSHSQLVIK